MQDLTQENINNTAEKLVEEAYKISREAKLQRLPPSAAKGSEALSETIFVGKQDDITVILAAVLNNYGNT